MRDKAHVDWFQHSIKLEILVFLHSVEQFKDLVNRLKEIRLTGQVGTKSTNFRCKEGEREI